MILRNLRPRVSVLMPRRIATLTGTAGATPRLTGRAAVERRERWLAEHPLCGDRRYGRSSEHSRCAREGRLSIGRTPDHVVPLWKGGADDESNLQTLCNSCHAEKTKREASERAALGLANTRHPGG